MATYASDADVTQWLNTGDLPTTIDSEAERLTYITRASALVDSLVGARFGFAAGSGTQKFEDYTTGTPEIIRQCTGKLAAAAIVRNAFAQSRAGISGDGLEQEAYDVLAMIRSGEIDVSVAGTRYGEARGLEGSEESTSTRPTFSTGEYDVDGRLVSDYRGTLDDM